MSTCNNGLLIHCPLFSLKTTKAPQSSFTFYMSFQRTRKRMFRWKLATATAILKALIHRRIRDFVSLLTSVQWFYFLITVLLPQYRENNETLNIAIKKQISWALTLLANQQSVKEYHHPIGKFLKGYRALLRKKIIYRQVWLRVQIF